jgi:hypothetical protein
MKRSKIESLLREEASDLPDAIRVCALYRHGRTELNAFLIPLWPLLD